MDEPLKPVIWRAWQSTFGAQMIQSGGERIAILGGGMGGLAAALELSDPKNPRPYEINVYQLGWRLGGKAASGRNQDAEKGKRVEEHGIHVLFGFYDNIFSILRRCYEEMQKQPFDPIEVFAKQSGIALADQVLGSWGTWTYHFPEMPGCPGDEFAAPSKWDLMELMCGFIADKTNQYGLTQEAILAGQIRKQIGQLAQRPAANTSAAAQPPVFPESQLEPQLCKLCGELESDAVKRTFGGRGRLLWLMVQFGARVLYGMVVDRLVTLPVTTINDRDFARWLESHGASRELLDSAVVRAFYDLVFAYPLGDTGQRGNLEAGTNLNIFLNALSYRGPLMWEPRAGTGDVIFAPLYRVLRQRGVKFLFFHRVTGLRLDSAGTRVQQVLISRQVQMANGRSHSDYEPLEWLRPFWCWRSRPDYSQIVEGDELRARKIDLESFWTDWVDTGGPLTLEADHDFSRVIFAIPLGAVRFLCADLVAAKVPWRQLIDRVTTVQTQDLQLWFLVDLKALGWRHGKVVLGGYDCTPLDSWAPMDQLRDAECWPQGLVNGISYLCGPLRGPAFAPHQGNRDYPRQQYSAVHNWSLDFLTRRTGPLWPLASGSGGFDWQLLVASAGTNGPQRLDEQYLRPNIDPAERYVQSPAGSSIYRMRANGSGLSNLFLAGDWTCNGLNIGCIEAAAISGRQAARAISGFPEKIPREKPH
jgi:uncharacterized protein with NAD-binding domain and iron-sulfur cluster